MERKIYLLALLSVLIFYTISGQNNKSIYRAYVYNQMNFWKKAMDSIETSGNLSDSKYLELLNYYYGYIAWCISNKNYKDAKIYIEKSEKIIDLLDKHNYKVAILYSYKAALIGYEIGISKYKAPFIGRNSIKYAKESIKLDNTNAMGYLQLGNIAYYTPKLFGGSKKEALDYYLCALKLMEKNQEQIKYNWNYLNLLVNIINTYVEMKQYDLAEKFCIKALQFEPEFDWVKNDIYPKLSMVKENE